MMSHRKKLKKNIEEEALRLIDDPGFLFKAGSKIGDLGIVGEERTRLILLLAGIARTLPEPPSVLVKGSTSSGKSTLLKDAVQLFPLDCVIERAGLSGKALAYGRGSLANKILLINEYRCGKDAQLLLRLLQSEGRIRHESTTVQGTRRRTETMERIGAPVVLTTTTEERVFADDETRFLSVWVDESPSQTLAILTAQASGPKYLNYRDLPVWRTAMSLITCGKQDFKNPPDWLRYVARQLPLGKVRVRRDWNRFLSFCKAVALCRRPLLGAEETADITFADYCVAYQILEPVLASTMLGLHTQELALGQAVVALSTRLGRAVTTREIAEELNWKDSLVYKHVKPAVRHRLLEYESGTREKNVKRLLARTDASDGFLPTPKMVFKNNPEIGAVSRYVDPFTGKKRVIRRVRKRDREK
jgi:hypothetical protein